MKILLVSDIESKYIWDYFDHQKFKDIDLVISCGDLKSEYLSFLVTMIKAPLFYVPGNHDGKYITNPPEGCDSIDGRFINYNGIRIAGLGGCKGSGPGPYIYTDGQMKGRVHRLARKIVWNRGLDILVTHAAADGVGDGEDLCHQGFASFNYLLDTFSPSYFIHGHIHLNYGRQQRILRYGDTTVINAYGYHILDYHGRDTEK